MNCVERHGCSTAKVAVEDFVQIRAQFLFEMQTLVEIEETPSSLIINEDQIRLPSNMFQCPHADEGSK